MKRILIVVAIGGAIFAFFYLGLGQVLTLDNFKAQQASLDAFNQAKPLAFVAAFAAIYIAMTGASLPGASLLTLAAGALFGLVEGTIIVSIAASIGATLAFLASRHLFREPIQARFNGRLKTLNDGMARDGAFYLFTLRLVPVFPFFVINPLMGLTSIRTWTFYWVSQIGMLAGTIVYVNAGTQVAKIATMRDIASPGLIGSFVALGLFPWFARWLTGTIKTRRLYAKWRKPRHFDRNLIVIGGGAAGLVSSLIATTVGAKVTLVEAHKMGGDCLNYGCVPSKALIRSAKLAQNMRDGDKYGLSATVPHFSFRDLMRRIDAVIRTIEPNDSVERYTAMGVDVVKGHATIVDPWTVEIARDDGVVQRLTTRSIVIAAGAAPFIPPLPGLDASDYVTSDTLWEKFGNLDVPPARLVVLGGGPIGCELSQSFARLGSQVTQIEMAPRVMIREDVEVSALARQALEASGVEVLVGHKALRCEIADGNKWLIVEVNGVELTVPFDAMLVAVGRAARLTGYGLEALGIETAKTVVTNAFQQTVFPNIYAAGDVAGPYQFTHTAAHQAWFAAVNALFGRFWMFKTDYRVIPWTTFLDPEFARVGLNEQEAIEQAIAHEVTVFPLHDLDRAVADSATEGFVKVLTPPGKDRILGVTIVGNHAGEILAEYVLAMKHGLGLGKILGTIHSYPTMSEANKYAAGAWKRAHAPHRLLRLVARYHDWMRG